MGKGPKNITTTQEQKTRYPEWTQQGLQDAASKGYDLNKLFFDNPLGFGVAGFTPDQTKSFDMARGAAHQFGPGNAGSGAVNSMIEGAGFSPTDYQQFMNPYLDDVGRDAVNNMRREHENAQAGLSARYAARGGLGGSGEGFARARTARGFNEAVPGVISNIMSGGFDRANNLALQSAQHKLAQAGAMGGAMNSDLNRQLAAMGAVGQGGLAQQQLMQNQLDLPYTALQRWASLLPQVVDSDQSGTSTQPNPNRGGLLQGILGFASAIPKLAAMSDETTKTDIEKVGTDDVTGLDMYAYRYKSDPKTYPKTVGPMAQDIQKKYPDQVQEIAGKLTVKTPFMQMIGAM